MNEAQQHTSAQITEWCEARDPECEGSGMVVPNGNFCGIIQVGERALEWVIDPQGAVIHDNIHPTDDARPALMEALRGSKLAAPLSDDPFCSEVRIAGVVFHVSLERRR